MQASYKRIRIISSFGLLLLLLAVNAAIIRYQLGIQANHETWIEHSQRVLLELSRMEAMLTAAESGQRGYLYTGNPKYLTPCYRAIQDLDAHLDRLAQMTADNPVQQSRIPALREAAQQEIGELHQTALLYQAGLSEAARARAMPFSGATFMDNIRQLLTEMQLEEASLEGVHTDAYRRSRAITIRCIYLLIAMAAIGLALLAILVQRQLRLRERYSTQIRLREEWYRVTLTCIGDGVIATDRHGCVIFMNSLAESLTGVSLEQAKGQWVQKIFPIFNEITHEPMTNPVSRVLAQGCQVATDNPAEVRHAEGSLVPIEFSAAPIRDDKDKLIGVVLIFHDMTRERKAQEAMRKTEKLNATARLASSVAHEINNPLESVGNLIYLVRMLPGLPDNAIEYLEQAESELERVSHFTRLSLGFYRGPDAPEWVDMKEMVDCVVKLYANKLKTKNIRVVCDFDEVPQFYGITGELEQLVSSLLSNAADAVGDDGVITVRLAQQENADGKFLQLVVEDNGPGIAAESKDKLFEPFYTTKPDVGTGLGLWMSREIVNRHGGSIMASSATAPGVTGATFTVMLPLHGLPLEAAQHSPQPAPPPLPLPSNGKLAAD